MSDLFGETKAEPPGSAPLPLETGSGRAASPMSPDRNT